MILRLDREDSILLPGAAPGADKVTWGDIYVEGDYCVATLEDEVREKPGRPPSEWKIAKRTAIGEGIYRLGLVNSPHFGADTIAVLNVPGFDEIRIHGGTTVKDTEGCILVGSRQDRLDGTLHGAKFAQVFGGENGAARVVVLPALATIKEFVVPAIRRGEACFLQVRNAPAWYVEHGLPVPKAAK